MQKFKLRKLSNDELDQNLKSLVGNEREILGGIISHILEIDTRRLYLTYGFPNLFTYLTEHVGYSSGSAQRRIAAARLAREVPDVVPQIEQGNLNLSQISLIHQSIRQAESEIADKPATQSILQNTSLNEDTSKNEENASSLKKRKISTEEKKTLVSELAKKSMQESEKLVKTLLDIAPKTTTKTSHQQDGSVRLEITFSEEQWKKMNKLRDLLSHSVPGGSWDQLLEHVCDQIIKQKDKTQTCSSPSAPPVPTEVKPLEAPAQVSPYPSGQTKRVAIPASVKRAVIQRDQGCCQYVDKKSGRKCASTWQLSLDHIRPVWAGGGNEISNLQVLCLSHNHERYRRQANINFV